MVLIDSYSEANRNDDWVINTLHPSASSLISVVFQSFSAHATNNYKITSAKFMLKKTGSPTGTLYFKLYSHSGTFGTSSLPSALLGTSAGLDVSTLDGTPTLKELTFTGAEQATMTAAAKYVICAGFVGSGSLDGGNMPQPAIDTSSPSHGGNTGYWNNSAWTAQNAYDAIFYVYGELISGLSIPVAMHHYGHHISKIIRG